MEEKNIINRKVKLSQNDIDRNIIYKTESIVRIVDVENNVLYDESNFSFEFYGDGSITIWNNGTTEFFVIDACAFGCLENSMLNVHKYF